MTKEDEKYPEIRATTRKDRKKLSRMIKEYINRSGNTKLAEMIPSVKAKLKKEGEEDVEPTTEEIYDLLKSVMESLFQFVEDELTAWFMEITGIETMDEFDELPFDVDLYIIDKLLEQKGFKNFFMRASALYKKIRG